VNIDSILSQLEGVKRSGSGWVALCPCHEDRTPSLSITETEDGKVLYKCFAGCTQEALSEALRGVLSPSEGKQGKSPLGDPSEAHIAAESVYDYVDENGALLYQVLRMPGKDFPVRRPDGSGGWIWGLGTTRRILYRLPEVIQAVAEGRTVAICEGEKDVEAVRSHRQVATCNPGGAGKWRPEYSAFFKGATVILCVDPDAPGRKHGAAVRDALEGVAKEIIPVEAKDGKDPYDHLIVHGLRLDEMVPVDLSDVSDEVPLSSVEMKSVEWHIEPFVQVAAFHLLAGPGKVGKGTWLALLMAKVTRGDTEYLSEPRNVLIVASEDSAGTDLLPRLIAAGGDPAKVHIIKKSIELPRDIEYLEGKIDRERGGVRTGLLIIDPVANHVGNISGDEEGAVRHAINELNYVADRTGCAIIGVRHVNKTGEGTKAVLGSVAWTNSPRVVLMMAQDETNPDTKILSVAESNRGGKGRQIRYDLKRVEVPGITGLTPLLEKHRFVEEAQEEPVSGEWFSVLSYG